MYLNEFDATLQQIQGKWKIMILYELKESGVVRFNELSRHIEHVSNKTLSAQLKELEESELISKEIFPTVPPKVEYRLTQKGESIIPLLDAICDWGLDHVSKDKMMRVLCDE